MLREVKINGEFGDYGRKGGFVEKIGGLDTHWNGNMRKD